MNRQVHRVNKLQESKIDIMIAPTVRCNLQGDTGQVGDGRCLDVALTRAKRDLIMIGRTLYLCARYSPNQYMEYNLRPFPSIGMSR